MLATKTELWTKQNPSKIMNSEFSYEIDLWYMDSAFRYVRILMNKEYYIAVRFFFWSPIIIFVVSSHKLYMMARKLTPRKSSKQFCYFLNTQINFLKNLYLMTVIYYFKNCMKKGKKLFFKAKIIFHGNLFEGLSIA